MKKTLLTSAIALLIMHAAGCGKSSQSPTPAPAPEASAAAPATPQDGANDADYIGSWKTNAGNGVGNFTITVLPNHTASNTQDKVATGAWETKGGQLQIKWSNGWTDVIQKQGTRYTKSAFSPGADLAGNPNNKSQAVRLSDKDAAPTPAAVAPPAPVIKDPSTHVKLPAPADSVTVAKSGQYLIFHLPSLRQLAFFDVKTSTLVKMMPLASDDVAIAANADKFFVGVKDIKVIQRYDLESFKLETTAPAPQGGIGKMAAPAGGNGPLMIISEQHAKRFSMVDPVTLQSESVRDSEWGSDGSAWGPVNIHVSFDGSHTVANGGGWAGIELGTTSGSKIVRNARGSYTMGETLLSGDGSLVFKDNSAVRSDLTSVVKTIDGTPIPAASTAFSVAVARSKDKKNASLTVFANADPRPLFVIPNLPELAPDNKLMPIWDRVFFAPQFDSLVTLASTADELQVRTVKVTAELNATGIDYLFVDSTPPAAKRGESYSYKISAQSKRGGVKMELTSAPQGMALSPEGKITWNVPREAKEERHPVIVTVSDASGQSSFHTFTLDIGAPLPPPPIVIAVAPTPTPRPSVAPTQPVKQSGTPAAATLPAPKGLVIVKAEWGSDGATWVNVTDKVQPRVVNNRLELTPTNDLFGDPAQGKPKKLRLTYTVDGVEKRADFDENAPVMVAAGDANGAGDLIRIKLPEPFADFHPADGGRYLVFHLPKARQIAVFETVTGKLFGTIKLTSDDVRFAAGKDAIYVANVDQGLVMNYSLATLQRGKVYPLPENKPLRQFAAGSDSTGPLFIEQSDKVTALDTNTGAPIKFQSGHIPQLPCDLRVSADGTTLVAWNVNGGQHFEIYHSHNGDVFSKESFEGSDMADRHYNVNADGSLFFYGGRIYDEFTRPLPQVKPYSNAIPTADPRYFLAIKGENNNVYTIAICTTGDRKALCEVRDIGDIGDAKTDSHEPRVVYLPDEKVIASIPLGNQEFQIRRFDLVAALGENCLFVDSHPSLIVYNGRNFEYTPHVISKHGGVKFELTAGPQGMTLAPDTGRISWHVPLNWSEAAPNVIVSISDAGGQSVFHTFTLAVAEPPAVTVAIAPSPSGNPPGTRQPPGTRTPGTPTVTRPPNPRPEGTGGGLRVITGIQTTIILREPLPADKIEGVAPKIKPLSEVRGLVVSRGADDDYHGTAIDIIATASREPKGTIAIRGVIGREMRVSLDEAIRLVQIRHPNFDKASIDLSFGDKYSIKDGGSAGTAFALVLLDALGDLEFNPDAAITGDITIDSKVRTIGEAPAKAHGAALDKTKIVAIPEGNASEFDDTIVLTGAPAFLETQIFTVRNIDDAIAVVRKDPDPKLVSAMAMFDQIKAQYATTPTMLSLPATSEKLGKILELAPNHLSAKNLLLIASGKAPKILTAVGTVHEALRALGPVRNVLTDSDAPPDAIQNKDILEARKNLAKLQPIADKTAAPVIRALDDFCIAYTAFLVTTSDTRATKADKERVAKAFLQKEAAIDTAMDAVFTNKEVIDKLMHD